MPEGHTEIRRSPKQYFDQSQGVVALRSGLAPVSWTGESLGSDYLIWRHVALLFETFFGSRGPLASAEVVEIRSDARHGVAVKAGVVIGSIG